MKAPCFLFIPAALFIFSCTSATSNKEEPLEGPEVSESIDSLHAAGNFLEWPGNYKGGIPGKEGDSTTMEVTINRDNTFAVKTQKVKSKETIEDKGEIAWESNETYLRLKGNTVDYYFRLGDDEIYFLDKPENVAETATPDEYSLKKQQEYATHDKHQRFPVD